MWCKHFLHLFIILFICLEPLSQKDLAFIPQKLGRILGMICFVL